MSNGTININIFERLLQRFRFKESLPDEVKKFIIQYERNALVTTFKRFNEYNFVYGFVIRIFYLSYKLRLRFSVKQSKIILAVMSILILTALSVSILFSAEFVKYNEFNETDGQISPDYKSETNISKPVINRINEDNKKLNKTVSKNAKYRLGVNLFSAKNIEEDMSTIVTDNISGELIRILGRDSIVDLRKNQKGVSYNKILSGSIARLGKKIFISAKVIDIENSKVIFGTSKTIESENEIKNECNDIAEMIVKGIESE